MVTRRRNLQWHICISDSDPRKKYVEIWSKLSTEGVLSWFYPMQLFRQTKKYLQFSVWDGKLNWWTSMVWVVLQPKLSRQGNVIWSKLVFGWFHSYITKHAARTSLFTFFCWCSELHLVGRTGELVPRNETWSNPDCTSLVWFECNDKVNRIPNLWSVDLTIFKVLWLSSVLYNATICLCSLIDG